MGSRAKWWVMVAILAGGLWAGGSSKAEEKAQPKAFNSAVAFDVYAAIGDKHQLVGITPSERPLTIPPCQWWHVEPRPPVDMAAVCREVQAQRIPGLRLRDATDEHMERVAKLTALQYLDLFFSKLTDAGLARLKGLTALQSLRLVGAQVTDAGLEHLKGLTALQRLYLGGTQVTGAGVEQLKKSLPNVRVVR